MISVLKLRITESCKFVEYTTCFTSLGMAVKLLDRRGKIVDDNFIWLF
jgi:hypothetical protein